MGLKPNHDLRIGAAVTVRVNDSMDSVSCRVIGFKDKEYVIMRAPENKMPLARSFWPAKVLVNYFNNGIIYGYKVKILHQYRKPDSLVVTDYPDRYFKRSFRGAPRTACSLPAAVEYDGKFHGGELINISATGCHFVFHAGEVESPPEMSISDKVRVGFILDRHEARLAMNAVVRNKDAVNGTTGYGLSFETIGMDEEIQMVEQYVHDAVYYRISHL